MLVTIQLSDEVHSAAKTAAEAAGETIEMFIARRGV
jgi:hypothetical protein